MKKITSLAILALLTFSCTHQDQNIKFNVALSNVKSEPVSSARGLEIVAFDDRSEPSIIGEKSFGDKKIAIASDQNLTELLQEEISKNLFSFGFKKGGDKVVEVHLEKLKYKAKRKFFIGKSEASIKIKVIVRSTKTKDKFSKNFTLSTKGKHFLAPLEKTDSKTINNLIQETVLEIVTDKSLLKNLSK
jgi:uncharacterized lipoprotein YajG